MNVDKVWIVRSGHFYDGSSIDGVFRTRERASEYITRTYEFKHKVYYYRQPELNLYYVDFVEIEEYEVKE